MTQNNIRHITHTTFRAGILTALTLLTLLLSSRLTAQNTAPQPPVTISATIDSTQLTMGSRTTLHIQIIKNSHPGVYIDPVTRHEGSDIQTISDIEIRQKTTDSTTLQGGRIQIDHTYLLQPFDPGDATLGPFAYASPDGDTATTQTITIKVAEPPIPQQMRDSLWINPMLGPSSIPARWYDIIPTWWYWLLLPLILIPLILLIIHLYRKNGPRLIPRKKIIPPYDLAILNLHALQNKQLPQKGLIKQYYTELTDILRAYIKGRLKIDAPEMTTPQTIQALADNPLTTSLISPVQQLLQTADAVKFARYNPESGQHDQAMQTVKQFLTLTKPQPQQPQKQNNKHNTPDNPQPTNKK